MDNIHVEILIRKNNNDREDDLITICAEYLNEHRTKPGTRISSFKNDSVLQIAGVNHIIVEENFDFDGVVDYNSNLIKWHIYSLNKLEPQTEDMTDSTGNSVNVATDYILPCADLFTLWENLIYDDNVKQHLLDYSQTIMELSKRGVNFNIISCNKVILLHGPPGTGKTSLCKALAQKLSVRMKNTYPRSILIEINSHSLFSKWFSESGKLVTKMFERIKDVCDIPSTLVCVLIDEVESLAHAREQCVSGNEPSDAFKVVNAVLTQIDNIKRYSNVLILTTSNIMCAIDVAFVDRADVKQYIGPPSVRAINKIYKSCIDELIRVKVIEFDKDSDEDLDNNEEFTNELMKVSEASRTLSGRMLRKIPFLACATNIGKKQITLNSFMKAMHIAVKNEFVQRNNILNSNKGLLNDD